PGGIRTGGQRGGAAGHGRERDGAGLRVARPRGAARHGRGRGGARRGRGLMATRDYYQTLGVSQGATDAELKKAYRQLAMQFHPDKNPGDKKAEERFKEVSEAYAVLSDPDKRAHYDRFGVAPGPATGGGSAGGFGTLFEDVFENFFSVPPVDGAAARARRAARIYSTS